MDPAADPAADPVADPLADPLADPVADPVTAVSLGLFFSLDFLPSSDVLLFSSLSLSEPEDRDSPRPGDSGRPALITAVLTCFLHVLTSCVMNNRSTTVSAAQTSKWFKPDAALPDKVSLQTKGVCGNDLLTLISEFAEVAGYAVNTQKRISSPDVTQTATRAMRPGASSYSAAPFAAAESDGCECSSRVKDTGCDS